MASNMAMLQYSEFIIGLLCYIYIRKGVLMLELQPQFLLCQADEGYITLPARYVTV